MSKVYENFLEECEYILDENWEDYMQELLESVDIDLIAKNSRLKKENKILNRKLKKIQAIVSNLANE